MNDRNEEKWIGLAEVRQQPGVEELGKNRGGFVTVVLFAQSENEFEQRVRKVLFEMGFDLVNVDEVEPYDRRVATHEIDRALRTAADELDPAAPPAVALGSFHTFPLD
jgi:hypothetical protein